MRKGLLQTYINIDTELRWRTLDNINIWMAFFIVFMLIQAFKVQQQNLSESSGGLKASEGTSGQENPWL